ncbi:MAG: hypothetical protein NTY20_04740, partial [Candidatus Aenigmarchaeota archaeon]|nr:hypothetical protein [Candidatus Aenigmarchaeota archaeon]
MKRIFFIPAAVVLVIFFAYIYANYSFMFQPITTLKCSTGETGCIKNAQAEKENCIPSSTIIEGRNGILLMVNITREGDRCIRTEEVIESKNQENNYLLGHNVTCNYSFSQLDNASATACPGSLYDYVMPSGGGGGFLQPGIPSPNCGIDDNVCKDQASDYVQTCTTSQIVNTELRWEPGGYWTELIKVNRYADECWLYFEILNAVNLPPGVPSSIIGSTMTCKVPISEFPIQNLTASWCAGDLYSYIY